MGLYHNYFPLTEPTLTMRQIDRLEQRQLRIQAQIAADVKHDRARFCGTLSNGREINVETISELLVDLDPVTELPQVIDLLHDLVQLPLLQRQGFHTGQALRQFISSGDQVPDADWYPVLDYLDQSFDWYERSTHNYVLIENVYDLHDPDDFKQLAEDYYQTGDYN